MPARRSPRKQAQQAQQAPEVIEILSSDSEAEALEVEDEAPEPVTDNEDVDEQPLLKAAGIKYKTDEPEDEEPPQDQLNSPPSAKLAVRAKDTGSVKHRHVSIEIPLPTSSELRRRAEASASGSQQGNDEEVFKTPNERRHITFDDSDHDEFVTPREGPSGNPLESSISKPAGAEDEEEDEEESDDEAPPEAVSTRTAEAETLRAAGAAAKAAEQQAAASKRKRQERDAFLRRQAEERKRTQKTAKQEDGDDEPAPSMQAPEKRKRDVPKLLPLELLESDDEDDIPQQASPADDGKHKRRKLGAAEQALLREPKLPKDKRLGSTAYRVVKPTADARLAPKVKKQAVDLRETLLRRDRAPQRRGGFFVKSR